MLRTCGSFEGFGNDQILSKVQGGCVEVLRFFGRTRGSFIHEKEGFGKDQRVFLDGVVLGGQRPHLRAVRLPSAMVQGHHPGDNPGANR